jgi:hypothetical protein
VHTFCSFRPSTRCPRPSARGKTTKIIPRGFGVSLSGTTLLAEATLRGASLSDKFLLAEALLRGVSLSGSLLLAGLSNTC